MALSAMLFCFLLCTSAVYAADHVVGGTAGWNLGQNYSGWATSQTFTVGDNLVFNYNAAHNVIEVDKDGYDDCDGSDGTPHSGGPTNIPLSSAGLKYFICSIASHCSSGGMKLAVTVQAGGSPGGSPPPSGTPPTTPAPPVSPTTPPAAPTTPTTPPSQPPPPPTGGAGSLGNSLVVEFIVVLATLCAFMG